MTLSCSISLTEESEEILWRSKAFEENLKNTYEKKMCSKISLEALSSTTNKQQKATQTQQNPLQKNNKQQQQQQQQ